MNTSADEIRWRRINTDVLLVLKNNQLISSGGIYPPELITLVNTYLYQYITSKFFKLYVAKCLFLPCS